MLTIYLGRHAVSYGSRWLLWSQVDYGFKGQNRPFKLHPEKDQQLIQLIKQKYDALCLVLANSILRNTTEHSSILQPLKLPNGLQEQHHKRHGLVVQMQHNQCLDNDSHIKKKDTAGTPIPSCFSKETATPQKNSLAIHKLGYAILACIRVECVSHLFSLKCFI